MGCLTIIPLFLSVAFLTGCGLGPTAAPEAPTVTPTSGASLGVTTTLNETRISPTATSVAPTVTPTRVDTMPPPIPPRKATPEGSQLIMVHIRARSSREVKHLRDMKLDIAKVRPDPDRPPDEESLSGGYIVEAVVTRGMLGKLEAMGFDVVEIPPPEK